MSIDLTEKIDVSKGSYGLNLENDDGIRNAFQPNAQLGVRSDADEQLLIHLEFQEAVHLTHILIEPVETERGAAERPTSVKLFKNRLSFGFDDVDSIPETQALDLSTYTPNEKSVLNRVKFQNTTGLTLFFDANACDEEHTSLGRIRVYGLPVHATDMKELKKVGAE